MLHKAQYDLHFKKFSNYSFCYLKKSDDLNIHLCISNLKSKLPYSVNLQAAMLFELINNQLSTLFFGINQMLLHVLAGSWRVV